MVYYEYLHHRTKTHLAFVGKKHTAINIAQQPRMPKITVTLAMH
jgi:hypothetical protein